MFTPLLLRVLPIISLSVIVTIMFRSLRKKQKEQKLLLPAYAHVVVQNSEVRCAFTVYNLSYNI